MRRPWMAVLVCLLTAAGGLCVQEKAMAEPAGLVGCWDFEEGQGQIAHDRSGSGNDGVIHGAQWRKGEFGTALWFDGVKDYVEIKDAPSLNFTGGFTLEAWVNADRIFHAAKIICKRGRHEGGGFWLDQINGARMCLYCGGPDPRPPFVRAMSTTWLSPGRWYHMAGTLSDGVMRIYINGRLEGTAPGPPRPDDTQGIPLLIGTYEPGSTYRWTGLIDEVRVYNRAIPPDEVSARFDETSERYLGSPAARCLDYSPDTVLLWLGQKQAIGVSVLNQSEQAVRGVVNYEIRNEAARSLAKGRSEEIGIPARGTTRFSFPFTASRAGRLYLRCWWGDEERSSWQRGLLCVEPPPQPREGKDLQLEKLEEIDCAKERPADKYCDDGLARVVQSPIGAYRETGARQDSRFAYRFRVKHPQQPHLLVVEYPDDKIRFMDINFCSPNRAQNYDIATGVLCGYEYPLTNKLQKHPIIFWPTDEDNAVFIMCWRGQPAAARSITVYEVLGGLPSLPVREPEGEPHRLIGHQWEDPSLPTGWGGDYSFTGFYNTISRMAQYFHYTGQNFFTYPIVFYSGPFYPSRVEGPAAEGRFGVADCEDWVRMILQVFEKENCCFIPSLTLLRLPSLVAQENTDIEKVRAGADTVNVVTRNNGVRGNVDVHGEVIVPRGYKRQSPTGPIFNVLHPKVQAAALRLIGEILDRYGDSPAFKGIAINMWIENMLWYGSLDSGYGDYEVGLFEKETGTRIPVESKDPERFSKRYDWLMANAKEKWLAWRCAKIHELWMKIYEMVRAKRPDLQLVIHCWLPYHVWSNKPEEYWYPGSLTRWARDGQTIEEIYREGGLDLSLYRGKPGLVIERQMFPADARGHGNAPGGEKPEAQSFRDFNFDPAVFAPYRNGAMSAAFIYNNYYENAVGRDHPLAGLWWKENPWRASAISPAHVNFMEAYAEPLAQLDACQITDGGTTCGTQGFEEYIQDFARAYRALPARPFEDFPAAQDPVTVRYLKSGGKFYFYVLNRLATSAEAFVTLSASTIRITDLASGDDARASAEGGEIRLKVSLGPFQLRSFGAPESARVTAVRISVPEEWLKALMARCAEARAQVAAAEQAGLPVTRAKQSVVEMEQALRQNRYARACHLAEGYVFKELARQLKEAGKKQ